MADLCDPRQVCVELGLDVNAIPSLGLERIRNLIHTMSQAARVYTGNKFEIAEYTDTFDGNCRSFYLRNRPVQSVVSVSDISQSPPVVQDPSAYGIDFAAGLIFPAFQQTLENVFDLDSVVGLPARDVVELWGAGRQRWQCVYNAGIGVPDDVKGACARWCASLRNLTPGVLSERIGDYAYTTNQLLAEMPGDVRLILNGYKGSKIRLG